MYTPPALKIASTAVSQSSERSINTATGWPSLMPMRIR